MCANTPAAKGRVERAHGTLQDRLVKEMRLEGISSMGFARQWRDATPIALAEWLLDIARATRR
jgi:hypothetical protein